MQIGVLNWFAKLWEIEAEDMWGYVTNCGTEGNLHGVLTARENLPDGASIPDPCYRPHLHCQHCCNWSLHCALVYHPVFACHDLLQNSVG